MRLASIINVWSDCIELLPFCLKNHLQFADGVIVIWSQHSNHWEKNDGVFEYILANGHDSRVEFHQLEPMRGLKPLANETRKRNHGIDIARSKGFTHFLIADADEFYQPEEIEIDKNKFHDSSLKGLVSRLHVYIRKPTLWTVDHTLVPTIHRLTKEIYVGNFRDYPFAYDAQGNAHIDPSRRPMFFTGIQMSDTKCHHLSYVRKNIDLKIDNSSANLKRSRQVIYDELRDAKPGYISRLYHQPLKESPNYFDIHV
jgi:hypothetical protein